MRTVRMSEEQTRTYDAGDSHEWRELKRHFVSVMDAIGEENWRNGVHVELLTWDGIAVLAHDYEGED